VFSPDGLTIAFLSNRDGGENAVYLKNVDGGGAEKVFPETGDITVIGDWSRDGRWLTFFRTGVDTGWDVWALAMSGPEKGQVIPVVEGPFLELRPSFSPDGRWIVYESDESGRPEVYVRSFPGPGGQWQISTDGGEEARWSEDGTEIFYLAPGGSVMSVPVSTAATFNAGRPREVFQVRLQSMIVRNRWLADRDGERFLVVAPQDASGSVPMTVVLNWPEALRED
jgi:Tol biopolymer transport system component